MPDRVIAWADERARVGQWRGDSSEAYLAPVPGGPPTSPAFLRLCIDTLTARGFASVMTAALAPEEQVAYLAVGFEEHQRLSLLVRDLRDAAADPVARRCPGHLRLRRARRSDRPAILGLDHLSFAPFWRLDNGGLDEAIGATASSRFRVAVGGAATPFAGRILGYAICGRAGPKGYVQRLAVEPDARRTGIGWALVVDGLGWMRRRGVDEAVVNTQPENHGALVLYDGLGFRRQPEGLAVLRRQLRGAAAGAPHRGAGRPGPG